MRVLFAGGGTGGHLYPGLAIARALTRSAPGVEPFFVGARRGIEREVLPGSGFPYLLLDLHPLYRGRPLRNWKTLRGALTAWRALGGLARTETIHLVVGTGGYAAALALAFARRHAIPYVLQEQNSIPGITMRYFARGAREVYLGFPEAAPLLSRGPDTVLVDSGNPIEAPPAVRPSAAQARAAWGFDAVIEHVMLVVGGSQGARAINAVVAAWVERGMPQGVAVIWATGRPDFEHYAHLASDRVRVVPYLSPIADAYAAADVAVARAGAMTTAELCAWQIPAVLVPLPTAAADHQSANARALATAGAAATVPQSEFSPERLDLEVRRIMRQPEIRGAMAAAASHRARPDAANVIAQRILMLLEIKENRT
jgi:UDP-N-acetylglucosamine--N-acetylmuramyl-(pentapeptide) pyrophosphoryl-undecaprenol N-acetylglucosamine transferase